MSISKDEVSDLITANHQLMNSFKDLLQDTVGQIKPRRANEDAADSQMREIKKLKFSEPRKFKRKANEDQYKFNLKLAETLDDAKSAAEKLQLDKVKTDLEAGEKLLIERQKHILLADKSDSGWLTVKEYKNHDLADYSDDEKRIFSAERRARSTLSSLRKKERFVCHVQETSTCTSVCSFFFIQRSATTRSSDSVPRVPYVYGSSFQYGNLFCLRQARALARYLHVQRCPNSSLRQLLNDYEISINKA